MNKHLKTMVDALINDDGKSAEIAFQQCMIDKTQQYLNPETESQQESVTTEGKNHMGETTYSNYGRWKAACRAIKPDVKFEGDKDICNAFGVGEWDGVEGSVWKKETRAEIEKNDKSEK